MRQPSRRFAPKSFEPCFDAASKLETLLAAQGKRRDAWQREHLVCTGRDLSTAEFCRQYADAIIVAAVLCRAFDANGDWTQLLAADDDDPIARVLRYALASSSDRRVNALLRDQIQAITPPIFNHEAGDERYETASRWVEAWFANRDRDQRKAAGIYFTPAMLADELTDRANRQLRDQPGFPHGLATGAISSDTTTKPVASFATTRTRQVKILDYAAGTGVFLLSALNRMVADGREAHIALQQLSGIELMPTSCAAARVLIAARAVELGATLMPANLPVIHLGDALIPETWRTKTPPTVILGNPPFLSTSRQAGQWIDDLMRGRVAKPGGEISYYPDGGAAATERKTWLHDDYVRFLRLGQYLLAGGGVMALVTNRGFLDNLTFRGLRQGLLKGFSQIDVVDFGREGTATSTGPMAIRQPLAATVFTRSFDQETACDVTHRDATEIETVNHCRPVSPEFFLAPDRRIRLSEYEQGQPLNEVMPASGSAAVTARDSFLIGFSHDEVVQRLERFTDLSIPDDEIRARDFTRSRSRRHAPGDTRGWKLAEARRLLAEGDSWRDSIRRFQYRPFDYRFIAWDERLIDWPRTSSMSYMLSGANQAIVTRRQAPFSNEYKYVTVADNVVVDGLIRNDNRGNETFFPAELTDGKANFADAWLDKLANALALPRDRQPTNPEVFQFVTAHLMSREYRSRYAAELCVGFPRVFLPRTEALFRTLSDLGGMLIETHLGQPNRSSGETENDGVVRVADSRRFPLWRDGRVWINDEFAVEGVGGHVWEHKIGSHQVMHKWLASRRGRQLSAVDLAELSHVQHAIQKSIDAVSQIDHAISTLGGWREAFVIQ